MYFPWLVRVSERWSYVVHVLELAHLRHKSVEESLSWLCSLEVHRAGINGQTAECSALRLGMENTWKENMEKVREQRKVEGEKKGKGDEE